MNKKLLSPAMVLLLLLSGSSYGSDKKKKEPKKEEINNNNNNTTLGAPDISISEVKNSLIPIEKALKLEQNKKNPDVYKDLLEKSFILSKKDFNSGATIWKHAHELITSADKTVQESLTNSNPSLMALLIEDHKKSIDKQKKQDSEIVYNLLLKQPTIDAGLLVTAKTNKDLEIAQKTEKLKIIQQTIAGLQLSLKKANSERAKIEEDHEELSFQSSCLETEKNLLVEIANQHFERTKKKIKKIKQKIKAAEESLKENQQIKEQLQGKIGVETTISECVENIEKRETELKELNKKLNEKQNEKERAEKRLAPFKPKEETKNSSSGWFGGYFSFGSKEEETKK